MTKREGIREGMQRLWCQHCKAMQKTNNTVVECWYNPLDADEKAFCASNEDAVDAILKDESDRGVVIKVDRELPTIFDINEDCISSLEYRKKLAGFAAVESLMGEK